MIDEKVEVMLAVESNDISTHVLHDVKWNEKGWLYNEYKGTLGFGYEDDDKVQDLDLYKIGYRSGMILNLDLYIEKANIRYVNFKDGKPIFNHANINEDLDTGKLTYSIFDQFGVVGEVKASWVWNLKQVIPLSVVMNATLREKL